MNRFLKIIFCLCLVLMFSSCSSKSEMTAEYLVIKDDGVPDYVIEKKGSTSRNFLKVLDRDMNTISEEGIRLNKSFTANIIDEKDRKLYCFGYGFVVVDIEKKQFISVDKYLTKDERKLIDEVEVKNDIMYYTTNEGVKNTAEKNWYKARFVSTDGKIDIDVGNTINKILFVNDEIYLHVLGFKDAKLIKYNRETGDFDDVENTFTRSAYSQYFDFNNKIYRIGYNEESLREIEDFETSIKYNMYFEDGTIFDNINQHCFITFHNYKDKLYIGLSFDDKNAPSGLYRVSIENGKFNLNKIAPKGFQYAFYNDCVSLNDHDGVYLYDLKTGDLITEYKDENCLIMLKLN